MPVVVGRSSPTATVEGEQPETAVPQTPQPTSTTEPGSPTPEPSPTQSPFIEYVVQDGDSLFSIAEANVPVGDDLTAYVEAIANLNGLDVNNPVLSVGATIRLPPLPGQ